MKFEVFDINNLVRENIRKIKPYASARDDFKDFESEMVFLDANENPFNNGLNRYPDPQQIKLKEVIGKQKETLVENILLGNGSDEVLDLIFRAFCEPNKDSVIILPPTYGMYEVLAETNAIEVIKVPLSDKFHPEVENILKSVKTSSKLLFLCSPNNPTANSFNADLIEKLIREFTGIVVIDEAYIDFSQKESWSNRLDEFQNLIVIQTLSKAYGLAGIRLGMCFASKEIITILNKIKPPYNINSLTQQKALEILSNTENKNKEVLELLQQREFLALSIAEINFVEKVYHSDANFLLIKVDNANKRYGQLIEKGIVVRNRTKEISCNNCLRITVGTLEENIKLINTLKKLQ